MADFPSLKGHFSRSLAGAGDRLHLAAHSHHLWPDASFTGHRQAWDVAAAQWDSKWNTILHEVVPEAQQHIARHLDLSDPSSIAFAPNTHEFVTRLFSALPTNRAPKILMTDSEFHSFNRQAARLAEENLIERNIIQTEPFVSFPERFAQAAAGDYDLVFISQVFFNSGYAVQDLPALVASVANADALIVIDGYHGFMARPASLRNIEHRAFYLAGGYKYAMAGEGACFLACPPDYAPRPRNTGWYAAFGALTSGGSTIDYGPGGARFLGATFDPSGLYRLNSVMRWLAAIEVDAAKAHARAQAVAAALLAELEAGAIPGLGVADLIPGITPDCRGNFLAFRSAAAATLHDAFAAAGIVTDVRGNVLRLGFGLYHDPADAPGIAARLRGAVTST